MSEQRDMTERHESDCKHDNADEPKSLVEMVKEAWQRPVSDRPSLISDEALDKAVEAIRMSDH